MSGWDLRAAGRAALDYVWDNPSAELDARAILNSGKIGLWLASELLAVLVFTAFAFGLSSGDAELARALESVGTGQYLISSALLGTTAFLTLVVPIRAGGLLEGPRVRGYLDQVVTSGVTPARYFVGKWATSQPFFLALLAATLPVTSLLGLLGGVSLGHTALAYLLLYAYCNLLHLVTAALGLVLHEALAVCFTLALAGAGHTLSALPAPTAAAPWSPIRLLLEPFRGELAQGDASIVRLYGPAWLFGLELPIPLWTLLAWATVGGLAALACCSGPLHAFIPGLNTFGSVVLPGDGKRLFLRRFRPLLSRRVELAFLFENRDPALTRWALPLRALRQLVLGGGLAVVLVLGFLHPVNIAGCSSGEEVLALAIGAWALAYLLLPVVLAAGRLEHLTTWPLGGGARLPLAALDSAVFLGVVAILGLATAAALAGAWSELEQAVTRAGTWSRLRHPDRLAPVLALSFAVVSLVALNVFVQSRAFVGRQVSVLLGPLLAVCLSVTLTILPMGFAVAGEMITRRDRSAGREPDRTTARRLFTLASLSPVVPIAVAIEDLPSDVRPQRGEWLMRAGFWLGQLALLLLGSAALLLDQRALLRSADELRAPHPPPATAPPCSRCGGRSRTPLGLSLKIGLLLAPLAGFQRCLDCHSEVGRDGRRPGFLTQLTLPMAEALLLLLPLILVAGALVQVVA